MSSNTDTITASLILVGSELLSGRTQDVNLNFVARRLRDRGITLVEARVISDTASGIQKAINELRSRDDYVFTTGGIGPTHDDITAENVAAAFSVPLITHPEAQRRLLEYFASRGVEANSARMRMARTPKGASLIDNPVSVAPGFIMGNVYVMAGVPRIMQAMLENVLPDLKHGKLVQSFSVVCNLPEGVLAAPLEELQLQFPKLDLGSYPGKVDDNYRVNLVACSSDNAMLEEVSIALVDMIGDLGGSIIKG